jgi:hypothetical protein
MKGPAFEIGEEELGTRLGRVKADDAEVLGSDLLDAGMLHTAGLAERGRRAPGGPSSARTRGGHETYLR